MWPPSLTFRCITSTQTGSSSTSMVRARGSVRVTVFCLYREHKDADVTLLSSRRVCWIWWESAHSWERWKRKGYQHSERAVRLQDCGDDWRRSHWSGGLPSCCKCFHPAIIYDWHLMHFLTTHLTASFPPPLRVPSLALEVMSSGSRWRSGLCGMWQALGSS